jgi:hypothetical protein
MRQILISMLLSVFSLAAHAELPGPVLTPAQKKLVAKDSCAQAAVEAATSAFVAEIKAAGVDLPEQIFVADLTPVHPGTEYSVSFVGGDTTFRVETQMGRASCRFTSIQSTP